MAQCEWDRLDEKVRIAGRTLSFSLGAITMLVLRGDGVLALEGARKSWVFEVGFSCEARARAIG